MRPIGEIPRRLAILGERGLAQHHAIALLADDVGVILGDAHSAGMGAAVRIAIGVHDQVEVQIGVRTTHLDGSLCQILDDARDLLLVDLGDDLEPCIGITRDVARRGRRVDALEPAGVGHDHALGVLDDAAAHLELQAIGDPACKIAGARGGECDGDGLGAAKGADKLTPQDVEIGVVGAAIHGPSSRCRARLCARLEETVALE